MKIVWIMSLLFSMAAAATFEDILCKRGNTDIQKALTHPWEPLHDEVMKDPGLWSHYLETAHANIEAIQDKDARTKAWKDFLREYTIVVAPMDYKTIHLKTSRFIACLARADLGGPEKVELWEHFAQEIRVRVRARVQTEIDKGTTDPQAAALQRKHLENPLFGFRNVGYRADDGSEVRINHGKETLLITPSGDVFLGQGAFSSDEVTAMQSKGIAIPAPDKHKLIQLSPSRD